MEITVNLNGQKRKVLAESIGKILYAVPEYQGPPTYAYIIGRVTVNREGAILFEPERSGDIAMFNALLADLVAAGYDVSVPTPDSSPNEYLPEVIPPEELPAPEPQALTSFTIKVPIAGFDESSLQNLRLLVQSKATLIKKALDIPDMPIETTKKIIRFPWFSAPLPPPELKAYTDFISALCDMAKRQKRIMAVEKPTDNEKFTFRLFLVRLGLIGDEYADTRRILLRNLSGNGSWKDGVTRKPSAPRAASAASPESTPAREQTSSASAAPETHRFSWRNWFKNLKMMGF